MWDASQAEAEYQPDEKDTINDDKFNFIGTALVKLRAFRVVVLIRSTQTIATISLPNIPAKPSQAFVWTQTCMTKYRRIHFLDKQKPNVRVTNQVLSFLGVILWQRNVVYMNTRHSHRRWLFAEVINPIP